MHDTSRHSLDTLHIIVILITITSIVTAGCLLGPVVHGQQLLAPCLMLLHSLLDLPLVQPKVVALVPPEAAAAAATTPTLL